MSLISSATNRVLILSMLKGVGPQSLRKLAMQPNFETSSIQQLAKNNSQLSRALENDGAWTKAVEAADAQLEAITKIEARILSPLDSDYPSLLSATKDDPFLLWIRGSLSSTPEKSVAIIGTREPTAHGEIIVTRITQYFVENGWSVVSGLAIGCDATAHKAAIEAKGHTVAVLAHGLHTIAPSRHRQLAEKILESGGALVSEYPVGQDARPQQFVKRDRTQAGMARGVVMIQSDIKGGSLHASRAALDYERWLAVPNPTSLDRANDEPKIKANLVLVEGAQTDKLQLLHCKSNALKNVFVLRSKEDYQSLTAGAVQLEGPNTPAQAAFL